MSDIPPQPNYGNQTKADLMREIERLRAEVLDLKAAIQIYVRELAELRAALKGNAEPVAWKPIETAPKDGTKIIAFAGGDVQIVYWSSDWTSREDWSFDVPGEEPSIYREGFFVPTHWMPFPAAPKPE